LKAQEKDTVFNIVLTMLLRLGYTCAKCILVT